MSNFEALLRAVDRLTQDEVRQLYAYLAERHRRLSAARDSTGGHPGAGPGGDDFGYEWSDEFWMQQD